MVITTRSGKDLVSSLVESPPTKKGDLFGGALEAAAAHTHNITDPYCHLQEGQNRSRSLLLIDSRISPKPPTSADQIGFNGSCPQATAQPIQTSPDPCSHHNHPTNKPPACDLGDHNARPKIKRKQTAGRKSARQERKKRQRQDGRKKVFEACVNSIMKKIPTSVSWRSAKISPLNLYPSIPLNSHQNPICGPTTTFIFFEKGSMSYET